MNVVEAINDIRRLRWQEPALTWGLVPTMGYLHAGHLSLVERARRENERVGVSIFVNPMQFSPQEDLSRYPRDLERDLALLEKAGADLVWTPPPEIVYPPQFQTAVTVEKVTQPLEGASRPTHFRGVATVVAKLFNVFQPQRAYFGQKDAQQAVVLKRMAQDLNFNLEVVVCPIVREKDGLALSSRNIYLSPAERQAATILHRSLNSAARRFKDGERKAEALRSLVREMIFSEPLARLDYVSVADPETLEELNLIGDRALLSMAIFFSKTRLIDNMVLEGS
jgi:pantoate--beta-alanine ligase